MGVATSTLGPLPCLAASMRSAIDNFLRIAHNTTCHRCPFAPPLHYSAKGVLTCPRQVPLSGATTPNATAPAALARPRKGRPGPPPRTRASANQARVQSRETHSRAGKLVPGLPQPSWAAMAGFELTAVYWPSVPTSPGGRQPTPKDRAALAPGGTQAGPRDAAQPSSESGPVAVDAPLREMHADPRVHCALS